MSPGRNRRRRRALCIGGALLALVLAGCGSSGAPAHPAGTTTRTATTDATTDAVSTTTLSSAGAITSVRKTIVTLVPREIPKDTGRAMPAALVRRVQRACEDIGGSLAGSMSSGGAQGPTAIQQLAELLLPRASGLQRALVPIIAKSGANSRVGVALSPLIAAVSGLQVNLQTAMQNDERAVSVSQIQREAEQVTETAYQLGLPQCTVTNA